MKIAWRAGEESSSSDSSRSVTQTAHAVHSQLIGMKARYGILPSTADTQTRACRSPIFPVRSASATLVLIYLGSELQRIGREEPPSRGIDFWVAPSFP